MRLSKSCFIPTSLSREIKSLDSDSLHFHEINEQKVFLLKVPKTLSLSLSSSEPSLPLSSGKDQAYKTGSTKGRDSFNQNFGPKLNGSVRSNWKSFKKTGPPFELDHFSRSDRSGFWLNGSHPKSLAQA